MDNKDIIDFYREHPFGRRIDCGDGYLYDISQIDPTTGRQFVVYTGHIPECMYTMDDWKDDNSMDIDEMFEDSKKKMDEFLSKLTLDDINGALKDLFKQT